MKSKTQQLSCNNILLSLYAILLSSDKGIHVINIADYLSSLDSKTYHALGNPSVISRYPTENVNVSL